jgi:hypothetical protein
MSKIFALVAQEVEARVCTPKGDGAVFDVDIAPECIVTSTATRAAMAPTRRQLPFLLSCLFDVF